MEIEFPTLIDLFTATKQAEGKSPKTISWYRSLLIKFNAFLGDANRLKDLSLDKARAFVLHLQARETRYEGNGLRPIEQGKLSAATIHAYVRTLKAFAAWLYEENFTNSNIFARLARPKKPETVIEILSDAEIQHLFDCINPNTFIGARLQLIVLLLIDTGMRASELCGLKLDNVHLNENYVKVLGKGSKERIIPISAATKKAILRYLSTFRPECEAETLIVSDEGTPLSYDGLFHIFSRLGRRAGIERLHPHLLRHTFAVKYLMSGADIMSLKLTLGHNDLKTTETYLHLSEAHLQTQHRKFSIVDKINFGKKRAPTKI